MGFFSSLFKKRAEDWFFAFLEPSQTPENLPIKLVEPNTYYLNVHLKSLRIVNVRLGLSKFYGAVHSFTSIPHRGGKNAEFNVLTTPNKLEELDAKHIDRVIPINERLLGPLPYVGGDLDIEVGLFSIKSADLAAPFIGLLQQMSTLSGVAFINKALPFAEPLKNGINILTGGQDDTILEIGLSAQFPIVKTGYFVVVRVPKKDIDVKNIKIDKSDFRLIYSNGVPVSDFPYMVFEISVSDQRDAWFDIPDLLEPYKNLQKDIREGDFESVQNSLIVFKKAALTCNDLLFKDAKRLYSEVENQVKEIMGTTTVSSKDTATLIPLNEINLYH